MEKMLSDLINWAIAVRGDDEKYAAARHEVLTHFNWLMDS